MKKLIISFICTLSAFVLSAATPTSFTSRWDIRYSSEQRERWSTKGEIVSTTGKQATIAFKGNSLVFDFTPKHRFIVKGMKKGDWIEFSAPVENLTKGSWVDISVYIGISEEGGPRDWVCEWYNGKKWKKVEDGTSFHTIHSKGWCETSYVKSFKTDVTLKNTELKVRLRVISDGGNSESEVYLKSLPCVGAYLAASFIPSTDTKKVLFLGNSFTYYGASNLAFLEICRSQGHNLDVAINVKGGQNFGQHMKLTLSLEAIEKGGFDIAFLQNQSQAASRYDSDSVKYAYILDDAKALAAKVRKYSPNCRLILERTWASPKESWRGYGSAEAFDAALQRGSEILGPAMGAELSPIGNAFILAREAGMNLYWRDDFHQNFTGAYLKACVNYLMFVGKPFEGEVANYGLDPAIAAQCREIAMKVVKTL